MRVSCALVLLLCAALCVLAAGAAGASLRRPAALSTLEWRHVSDSNTLVVHAYTSGQHSARSQLHTFAASVTVRAFLASPLVAALAADHAHDAHDAKADSAGGRAQQDPRTHRQQQQQQHGSACIIVSEGGQRLRKLTHNAGLLRALKAKVASTELRCAGVSWRFVTYTPPLLRPNDAHAQKLLRQKKGEMAQYPLDASELMGNDWTGIWGWIKAFALYHWGDLYPYPSYEGSQQTGRWHLNTGAVLTPNQPFGSESDTPVRIAIAADWAAGTLEADYVQQCMMAANGTAFDPHWTLHLGDIYYVGSTDAVKSNCLGIAPEGAVQGVTWPHGSLGSFAVMGNHEGYARGIGFFETFLPTLGVSDPTTGAVSGQAAGFVALENAYWRVILLDTGYGTYSVIPMADNRNNTQPAAVVEWLINDVKIGNESDTRGIIFLAHHQTESAFEAPWTATPLQVAALMPPNRTVIWLWGHEHRVAWYKLFSLQNSSVPLNVHGRCVGNSGFPASVGDIPARANVSGLIAYDDRVYTYETGFQSTPVSFNGFTHLTLERDTAAIVYSSLALDPDTGRLSNRTAVELVAEMFQTDERGDAHLVEFNIIDPELTIIQ